ncbi:TetR family transcriptional regulator [Streptomyces sp. ODS28]|uniref:TetR family transcriptional regulator n=1 Tax=Streptomyces sp. ODS28 TaxID=3136688 RepID=UPI0031E87E63
MGTTTAGAAGTGSAGTRTGTPQQEGRPPRQEAQQEGQRPAQDEQQSAAEKRRRELLEAADRVVLRDGPGASMNAIAAEAGITKPILYRHFGDKGGLYRALAVRHTDGLLSSLRAALDAPTERRERVEATLDTYLAAIEARPQVYRFLMHPAEEHGGEQSFDVGQHSAPLLRRLGEELAEVIGERVDLGPGGEELARVWGHGIVGMMHAAGDWWLRERPCPRAQLVQHLADLLWGRLAAAGDRVGVPGF